MVLMYGKPFDPRRSPLRWRPYFLLIAYNSS
jgi:hypothetical protein